MISKYFSIVGLRVRPDVDLKKYFPKTRKFAIFPRKKILLENPKNLLLKFHEYKILSSKKILQSNKVRKSNIK
jgi:hypothetical protein